MVWDYAFRTFEMVLVFCATHSMIEWSSKQHNTKCLLQRGGQDHVKSSLWSPPSMSQCHSTLPRAGEPSVHMEATAPDMTSDVPDGEPLKNGLGVLDPDLRL